MGDPRITNHESRITNHESRITNHKSPITTLLAQSRLDSGFDGGSPQAGLEDFAVRSNEEDRRDAFHSEARREIRLGPFPEKPLRPAELILLRVGARGGGRRVETQAH